MSDKPHGLHNGGLHNLNGNAKHGDFAYIPGTGPAGTRCGQCIAFDQSMYKVKKTKGKCSRAAEMRTCTVRSLKDIESATPACKYFDAKPRTALFGDFDP